MNYSWCYMCLLSLEIQKRYQIIIVTTLYFVVQLSIADRITSAYYLQINDLGDQFSWPFKKHQ